MVLTLRAAACAASALLTFVSVSPAIAAEASRVSLDIPATPIAAPGAARPVGSDPVIQILPVPSVHLPFEQLTAPVGTTAGQSASLSALVEAHAGTEASNEDQECIAAAVYFEARGEPIEGQLAVAQVVLNRAASGRYPTSTCAVVKQPAQFSFVRKGRIPPIAKATEAWRNAVAVTRVAVEHLAKQIGSSVLWYHASYVSPDWGRRLTRVTQIGGHIFYN